MKVKELYKAIEHIGQIDPNANVYLNLRRSGYRVDEDKVNIPEDDLEQYHDPLAITYDVEDNCFVITGELS